MTSIAADLSRGGVHVSFADNGTRTRARDGRRMRAIGEQILPQMPGSARCCAGCARAAILGSQAHALGLRHRYYFLQPPAA